MSEVAILYWNTPSIADMRAKELVEFLGLQAVLIGIGSGEPLIQSLESSVSACGCLLVSTECLVQLCASTQVNVGLEALIKAVKSVFVYGSLPNERHSSMLRFLSSGVITGVKRVERYPTEFHVRGDSELCRELAGMSLPAARSSQALLCFDAATMPAENLVVSVGEEPFFVVGNLGGSQVFLLAHDKFVDLNRRLGRDHDLTSSFPELVPLVMFLRHTMGKRVWHSEHARACFVVDDPLLQERYGCLEYAQLFSRMLPHKFSLSIAFIPWNHERSSREITRFFSSNSPRASLCIHGCDHTAGEFAVEDASLLKKKASLALDRMRQHRAQYGVSFDEVMVFPQGLFSPQALEALRSCGYLAAVNSDPHPATAVGDLRFKDLLEAAVMNFSDFPLFLRRYPKDVAEFALDLFIGKPAIVVEHHGYFRNGYGSLEGFVSKLNALNQRLEWTDLATICSSAYLTRMDSRGDVHLRFYASQFRVRNTDSRIRDYFLYRRHTSGTPMPVVNVNGSRVDVVEKDGYIVLKLSLDASEAADIVLGQPEDCGVDGYKQSMSDRAKASMRRFLSEFRDNYVETNRVLDDVLSHARKVRTWLN